MWAANAVADPDLELREGGWGGRRVGGSGLRLIFGGSGKRRGRDQLVGISGRYTKIILLYLISYQGRKK